MTHQAPQGHSIGDHLSPASFWKPDFVTISAWLEHAPFAFWLVGAARPRTIVELGTHRGFSYFSFCQAVRRLGLEARCSAIDTWRGDEHAGYYGEEVFEQVRAFNEANYGSFSHLLRSTFDESVANFDDGSIDILHIDGRHFYEDVRNDFETWRIKLSSRAVVLFHDTTVLDRGFGVYRLWSELRDEFDGFEFKHGNGLGVLAHGDSLPAAVASLVSQDHTIEGDAIRGAYERLGTDIKKQITLEQQVSTLRTRLSVAETDSVERLSASTKQVGRLEAQLGETLQQTQALQQQVQVLFQQAHDSREAMTRMQAELEYTVGRKHLRETQLKEHADEIERLKKLLRAERRSMQEIIRSRSWRLTRPLRIASHTAKWAERNALRAMRLVAWVATGQFPRAAKAIQPYYRRLVPAIVRRRIPESVAKWVVARWISPSAPVPHSIQVRATAAAISAAVTGSQPELHLSTFSSRRPYKFPDEDHYKDVISAYRSARATPSVAGGTAIFTAVVGGYDSVKLPEYLDPRYDYHLFTDGIVEDVGLFDIHEIDYHCSDRTRSARFVKTHPNLLLPKYNIAIWIDGNIIIKDSIEGMVDAFSRSGEALAAVPHPLRRSVFEEAAECIKRSKDDAQIIKAQIDRYEAEGFDCTDLVESNLLMFNLRHPGIEEFINSWWREIDRASRRDQLSLNYALAKAGLTYFRLAEWPNSVRNHPSLALLPHGAQANLTSGIRRLSAKTFVPWNGPRYAEVKDETLALSAGSEIDIVICVHNALEDLRGCLESIDRSSAGSSQRLIIIDDGSSPQTRDYIVEYADGRSDVLLRRHDTAVGYTRAANAGLRLSTAPFVILLNSDTVVTHGWAEKMARALASTPGAGLVGPLSNAASHQSIPTNESTRHQTAVNSLPPGLTPDDMNAYCERWAPASAVVRTSLAHGFCLGVSRTVIETVGVFDEVNFPQGYGEENDYCFRAMDAGFSCTIAINTFIWHAKSRSYPDAQRRELMETGNTKLRELHGNERVIRAIQSMRDEPLLRRMRIEAQALWDERVSQLDTTR